MKKWLRMSIAFLGLIIILGLWIRFWIKTPSPVLELGQDPVASVNFFTQFSGQNNQETEEEKDKYMIESAKIFSYFRPNVKQFLISSTPGLSAYADINIYFASEMDFFIAGINSINLQNKQSSNLAVAFSDKGAQKFVQLMPGQKYDLYITFLGVPGQQPEIILGNKKFKLDQIDGNYYIGKDFEPDSQFVGIKPSEAGLKINQAVFVSGESLSKTSSRTVQINGPLNIRNGKLQAEMPNNHFLFLESNTNFYLSSDQFGQGKSMSGAYYSSTNFSGVSVVDLNHPSYFIIVGDQGNYNIKDPLAKIRIVKYAKASLIVLIISLICLIPIVPIFRLCAQLSKRYWQLLQTRLKKDQQELVIYIFILILLLILRTGLKLAVLSIPAFLAIIILMLFIYSRFAIKFMTSIILVTLVLAISLSDSFSVSTQESLAYVVFFLLLIVALASLFPSGIKKQLKSKGKWFIKK